MTWIQLIQKNTVFIEYYTNRSKLNEEIYAKLSICADVVLLQIICNIKVRWSPTTIDDNIDFKPIITKK